MIAIGEYLVLARQVGATRIDKIDAGQAILRGDFLGAQVLLDGQRVIAAALHCRIIGDDDAHAPRHLAHPGDHAGAGDILAIDIVRRQLADLEERRAGIE